MWRRSWIIVLVLFAIVVGFGFVLPSKTRLAQSVTVNAPQQLVFDSLNNLKEFNAWSPWLRAAPDMTYAYAGPDSGEGASLTWSGKRIGSGAITIMSSTPPSHIEMTTESPERWNSKSWFDIARTGSATKVTWGYESQPYGFALWLRYYGAISTRPKLQKEYAAGLADFKSYIESKATMPVPPAARAQPSPQASLAPAQPPLVAVSGEPVTLAARPVLLVSVDAAGAGIETARNAAYAKIESYLKAQNLSVTGMPIAITRGYDAATNHWTFDAGIPLGTNVVRAPSASDGLKLGKTYAGKAIMFAYHGRPEGIEGMYPAVEAWITAKKLRRNGDWWQEYQTEDPSPKDDWNIVIYYPVK